MHSSSSLNNIAVFPNPVVSQLIIDKSESKVKSYDLELLNLEGKSVLSETSIRIDIKKLNVSDLPKGIYLFIRTDKP